MVKHSSTVRLDPTNLLPPTSEPSSPPSLTSTITCLTQISVVTTVQLAVRGESEHGASGIPQRKGLLPQYACNQLLELQHKFVELEAVGVFRRWEDVNITVQYLNPSFLVKKPSGGKCPVTAFADVGRYRKPQPSLMHVGSGLYLTLHCPVEAHYCDRFDQRLLQDPTFA